MDDTLMNLLPISRSPIMVIHVCDEAKNLQQDFQCPRDLLVEEMKYFAEYLSTDAQRWEEVDISVHCDVQIFDWLMKYVKRRQNDGERPKLEATNVISILISSDFLKMSTLVDECISFCHQHMSDIVSTPCNMNCINDRLTGRIAALFTHNEADDVKDRKDKYKSKLFAKKIEGLFDPNAMNTDSPEKAITLYKCRFCKRVLTTALEHNLQCIPSRIVIGRNGAICYNHQRDQSWDVNEYLIELKSELRSWRAVYWRLWGLVNFLTCSRCHSVFPVAELSHCKYHSEAPKYENERGMSPTGSYSCCGLETIRFDPTQPTNGCKTRDHIVSLDNPTLTNSTEHQVQMANVRVYDDLLAHRDVICMSFQRPASPGATVVDIFAQEEQNSGIRSDAGGPAEGDCAAHGDVKKSEVPRLQALTAQRQTEEEEFDHTDDEVGDDEEPRGGHQRRNRKSRVTVDPNAILMDAPDFTSSKSRKWDSTRSLRWNQDCQREDDQRRMKDMVCYLRRLRPHAHADRARCREFAGGVFAKLESQWRNTNVPLPKAAGLQNRTKTRVTHMKI